MANDQMKPIATLLLGLNFCMYVIVLGIGGWAMNRAIDHGFVIGELSPIFPAVSYLSVLYDLSFYNNINSKYITFSNITLIYYFSFNIL